MHYKNGRPAAVGDHVITTNAGWPQGIPVAGVLHSLIPGATSCNAQIAVPVPGGTHHHSVTVGQCVHVADAFAALEKKLADETVPQPPPALPEVEPVVVEATADGQSR